MTEKRKGRTPGVGNRNNYGEGSELVNPNGTVSRWVTIDGKRYKRTAKNRTQVRAKIAQLRHDIASGEQERQEARSNKTVSDLLDAWLVNDMPIAKNGRPLAPSSRDRHHYAADHLRQLLGKKRVTELTVEDVEDAYRTLATEPRPQSRASIVKIGATLSRALQSAVRRGVISRNVTRDAMIPATAAGAVPRRSLSPNDARALLAALRDEPNGLAYALSLRLGLRPGEAWALYWEDVDAGRVNVTRGLQRSRGTASISDDLKTTASKRTIALPDDLVEWFAEHRQEQRVERIAARTWHGDQLVFTGPHGRLVDPSLSRENLARLCKRLGFDQEVRPNELRHSCASLLSDEGVPNELIADLLGHTTTRMVDQTYRHRLRPVVDVAALATWSTVDTGSQDPEAAR